MTEPALEPSAPVSVSIRTCRFGEFELNPATRELLRRGARVELQPKVFDLIAYLLEHRTRVVDKDELLQAVWPRQVITETALTRAIMKARKALGDDAERPALIRTEHGRGYRFVAEVVWIESASREPVETTTKDATVVSAGPAGEDRVPVPDRPQRRYPWPWLGLTAALLLLTASLLWLWRSEQSDQLLPATAQTRVAILPLRNASGDPASDWLALGLMSAIAQILNEGGHIATVPPAEVLDAFPAGSPDTALAAADQRLRLQRRASHVYSGVLHAGQGNYRVAYVLRGPDGRERRRSVVGADASALARAIGADLLALLGSDAHRLDDMDDFIGETYLRGRALRLQGELQQADELFRIASEQSPQAFWPRYEYALTRRDLGDAEQADAILAALLKQARAGTDAGRLRAAANSYALLKMQSGALEEAALLLDEALAAARGSADVDAIATVLANRSIVQRRRGNLSLALDEAEAGLAVYRDAGIEHPPASLHNTLAQVSLQLGDHAAAEHYLQRAIEGFRLVGDRRYEAVALNSLARLRRQQRDYAQARTLAGQALTLHEATGEPRLVLSVLLNLSQIAQAQGALSEAERYARTALQRAETLDEQPRQADASRQLGAVLLDRGELVAARGYLERAWTHYGSTDEWVNQQSMRITMAELELAAGTPERAREHVRATLDWADEHTHAQLRWRANLALARIELSDQQPEAALQLCEPLLTQLDSADLPAGDAAAQLQLLRAQALLALDRDADAAQALAAASSLEGTAGYARSAAAIALASGDRASARVHLETAREAEGERWSEADQASLDALAVSL